MVLSHGNLSDLNIFVDPKTGGITGIADWEGAKVCPFGISLWGLEHVLGSMSPDGWRYHKNHRELRQKFWRTFEDAVGGLSDDEREAIEVARMAGLYLRYGFNWEEEGIDPVEEGTSSFMYLNAYCSEQFPLQI
jgi:DNA excision repair protein ERCC-4